MRGPDERTALNAFRAIASLIIVVYHFRYFSPFPWFAALPWLSKGYLGVDFFFVLSGVIISHVYYENLSTRKESFSRFLFLRIARVFPVHALIMSVMLLSALMTGTALTRADIVDWVTLTLMVRQWLMPDGYVWNSPAWSISAEMFAYGIIFPLVITFTRAVADRNAALRLIAAGFILQFMVIASEGSLNGGHGALPLLRVAGGFTLGCGIFRLFRNAPPERLYDRWMFFGLGIGSLGLTFRSDPAIMAGICVLVAACYMTTGPIGKALGSRPLHYLGEISFSLYLCHIPLFSAARTFVDNYGIHPGALFCILTLLISVALAAVLYECVECPSRRLLRRWFETNHARRFAWRIEAEIS